MHNPVGVTLLPQNTNCILLLTALNQSQSTPGCGRYCVSCASLYVTKLSITISINIKIKKNNNFTLGCKADPETANFEELL